jgi:hypothetical protein
MIMDMLLHAAKTTAECVEITSTYDATTGRSTETEKYVSVGKCIFFESGKSKGLFSDSMRENVQATAAFKPSVSITGRRMRIDGKKEYGIIGVEDVAMQGRVKLVYLGEIA